MIGCSHQKQALSFMQRREKGWDLTGTHYDIWKTVTDGGGHVLYVLCNPQQSRRVKLKAPSQIP
jgi:hypothetical protein